MRNVFRRIPACLYRIPRARQRMSNFSHTLNLFRFKLNMFCANILQQLFFVQTYLLQQQSLNKENDECSCIFYLSNLLLFSPLMNFNKFNFNNSRLIFAEKYKNKLRLDH